MVTYTRKPWLFFVLLLVLSYYIASFSIAGDTLSAGQPLLASKNQTITSDGSNFVLGFFKPGASSRIYLGIWYNNDYGDQAIVWVANREKPMSDPSSSRLELSEDGNLVLLSGSSNIPFWSTNLTHPPLSNSTEAVLGDDGNFVLRGRSNTSSIFWESFDHPTDTLLPGAKLGVDKITGKSKELISWKNSQDPAPGMFSFRLAPDGSGQFILEWNRAQKYWSTGFWNEKYFSLVRDMFMNYISNATFVSNETESYFTYSVKNSSSISRLRFVIASSGELRQLSWSNKSRVWTLFWSRPENISDVYGLCGKFGMNYENIPNSCVCLNGFKPFSIEETNQSDWSGGCVRKSPLQYCQNNNTYAANAANGKKDWFMKIPNVRLPVNSKAFFEVNAMTCEVACMNDCSCTAYAYNSSGCMIWERDLLNLQQLLDGGRGGQNISLRLAADEHQSTKGNKRKVWVILAVLVPATGLILCLSIYFSCKRKLKRKTQREETSRYDLLSFDFSIELHGINDRTDTKSNVNIRGKKKDAELPVFSYESVSAATNNFSTANKLGQGGFGPVYKGKSQKGQEIAVKVLSKRSGQGLNEFRNETILIAKLQHRNLVRLLGCCMERDEKMLIYEYMPNKSLDFYLFDQTKKRMLDWGTCIHIIKGIGQGLLYLHHYSRFRIIHRDLKPSNILLDSEMNPKISDFGMARIVGDNEIHTNTHRIVGTYGYMSPEYAMEGLYSIKSDVFSFGVLLLEILSGKKNTGFYNSSSLNLLRYAWELWRDDRSLDLMEPTIGYPSSTSILLRLINIGLLCVQESPTDRPTMLDVVSMIINEHAPLPTPKQPAFTRGRNVIDTNSTINGVGNCSISNLTISIMESTLASVKKDRGCSSLIHLAIQRCRSSLSPISRFLVIAAVQPRLPPSPPTRHLAPARRPAPPRFPSPLHRPSPSLSHNPFVRPDPTFAALWALDRDSSYSIFSPLSFQRPITPPRPPLSLIVRASADGGLGASPTGVAAISTMGGAFKLSSVCGVLSFNGKSFSVVRQNKKQNKDEPWLNCAATLRHFSSGVQLNITVCRCSVASQRGGMVTYTRKPWRFFVLLLVLSYYRACFSVAGGATLSAGESLSVSTTIISEGSNFELGFFRPGTSSKIYLGIWFNNNLDVKDFVWVANRENPLSDPSSSRLELSEDGNLLLLDASSNIPFWSTNLTHPLSNSTEAVLGDNGNFVLRDSSNQNTIFWESFDHPTDTWLPGAKLGIDKVTGKLQQLISWKNSQDPAPGMFSFRLARDGSSQFILEWNRSQTYASSGFWNGEYFSLAGDMFMNYISSATFVSNENESYFTYSVKNISSSSRLRFAIKSSGEIQQYSWSNKSWGWILFWSRPVNISDVYGLCGAFGVNYGSTSNPCECLNGFKPFSIEETNLSDWSGGCVRKSPLQCENITYANAKKDWFMKIPNVRLPVNSKAYGAMNCEVACMNNCSCTAYAYNSSGCMIWEGALLNLQQLSDGGEVGQDIYLRLAADEYQSTKGNKRKVWVILAVLVPVVGLILCLSICFSCKRKLKRKSQREETSRYDLLTFDFSTELHGINDGTDTKSNVNIRGKKKDVELPVFSYESVSAATNNFSTANKLGQGGFGPVYKGKSQMGQEIAVKMLSKRSGQGLEEFRNETILIAKLQHRNLVRLLGCCMERDEKMLIYEYMPNKSLDFYLFDQTKKRMLDWGTRIHIIEGIAQGLLYLHQYSRFRIIHRDLKPSNILLDSEMNPKISDFGMARIVGDNETQTNTQRIVGTYGYMSPEYAMEGLYSIKSDVFSFGVLLLEILSGKKNTGFYNSSSLNLLRYAWELWRDDRSLDLMEPTIGCPSSTSILLRFINIGLLCVQESPTDRPTMLDVVSMIINEHAPLPTPKQPAFTRGLNVNDTNSTINSVGNCSISNLTISITEAR
ncbi:uncharacterized protein LOC132170571 [Corylus avellana]|uniref:uncharacterized protein LOC132170571 n=1 Tax=Corylus avellana TaxID=13451 RepID=UPI00286D2741|nr:uncharacterized protein LOC132170571 [Corylus avellana]